MRQSPVCLRTKRGHTSGMLPNPMRKLPFQTHTRSIPKNQQAHLCPLDSRRTLRRTLRLQPQKPCLLHRPSCRLPFPCSSVHRGKLHSGSGVLLPSGFHVRERTFRDSLPTWALLHRWYPRQADVCRECGMVLPRCNQVSRRHQMPRWTLLHGKGKRQDGLCRRHGFCG